MLILLAKARECEEELLEAMACPEQLGVMY